MRSYILILLLFSVPASVDLALIRRDKKRDRMKYGIKSFLWMVVASILFGWLMYILK